MSQAYGIVFSGGGALGSWEVGCYKAILSRHEGRQPYVVTGASAGAINAVGVCAGMLPNQIEDTWTGLRNNQIYTAQFGSSSIGTLLLSSVRRLSIVEAITEFARKTTCIYSTAPFEKTLTKVLSGYYQNFVQSNVACVISLTNLTKAVGEIYYKLPVGESLNLANASNWNRVTGLENLVQVLLGSTALPILFPPQYHFFDGGVLLNQPISPALDLICTGDAQAPAVDLDDFVLYVIIPSSEALGAVGNLLEIGSTVISSWLSLSLVAQIRNVRLRNRIRSLTNDKQIRICVIRPPLDLTKTFGVSLLDFGKNVAELVSDGERAAYDRMNTFKSSVPGTWY
jgi:predicted acylesterase/phospholipase RssA